MALSAIGFFIFWARTRFWLPKYAHILAAIGLVVGLWCVSNTPNDAPINKGGPTARLLSALALPAMVYFFFVFYGGQQAAHRSRFGRPARCPPLWAASDGSSNRRWHSWSDCRWGPAAVSSLRQAAQI